MKRVINLSLLICAILFSTIVNASDVLSVKIENSSTINVSLSNTSQGQKLYLKDYSGAVLFNITLDAVSSYRKYFNLSTVEDGIYFVETETEFDIKVTPVLKNPKGIALINNSAITVFKPKVDVENTIVKVMLNRVEKSPLSISIYDREGVMLFSEKAKDDELIFQRTYSFSDVPSGKYIIYFSLKDRKFIKEVSI
ncbi:PPC domain-containing protein [Aquimarina sp. 2304DJ70-9]|uniref:PPC domain-containing protein n=1 Tax=Aquimarina penaris TaxID=3231044 RepID=UPI003461BEAB